MKKAVAADHHEHHQEQAEPEGPVLRRPAESRSCISLKAMAPTTPPHSQPTPPMITPASRRPAVEIQHVERREAGGLHQQARRRRRAIAAAGVDTAPGARRRSGRSPRRAGGCRGSPAATSRKGDAHDARDDHAEQRNSTASDRGEGDAAVEVELERPSSGPIMTPCRPSAPPVNSSLLASSRGSPATPSVTIRRVRSEPRDHEHRCWPRRAAATRPKVATARPTSGSGITNLGEQRRRVGAGAEEGRVAERDDAGIAEDRGRATPRTAPGSRSR